MPNRTYQTKPTKPNLQKQTYQIKPTKPYLPNPTYQTKPNITNPKPTELIKPAWICFYLCPVFAGMENVKDPCIFVVITKPHKQR